MEGIESSQAAETESQDVARLAEMFPGAVRVRIPVRVTPHTALEAAHANGNGQERDGGEETVIEFGTPREVMFALRIPLDFEEHVRLRNQDGSLDVEGKVIAVQYNQGRTAVAVRFTRNVVNWIIKG